MKKLLCLLVVAVLAIPTVAQASYSSGSCGNYWYTHWVGSGSANFNCTGSSSFSVSFSGASFVTGLGWSTGSGRTINFSGSASGANWGPGVYGWYRSPLTEYYIGKGSGSYQGSYSCNGRSYTLYVDRRYGQPSIDGTADFDQNNASGSRSGPVDMGCHFNAWSSMGHGPGSQAYQVVMIEGWSGASGSGSVTLGGGGSTSTTTTTSGGSTTTTSGGGGTPYRLRARSTDGAGRVNLRIDNQTIATFTLGTSMGDYTASSYLTGGINVEFFNDTSGRDVQVDYLSVDGDWRQAEDQSYNTAVWQDGSCGGSYSEWMHCNGVIGFGNTPGGGGSTTTTSGSTTTTTSSWWWGGWW